MTVDHVISYIERAALSQEQWTALCIVAGCGKRSARYATPHAYALHLRRKQRRGEGIAAPGPKHTLNRLLAILAEERN